MSLSGSALPWELHIISHTLCAKNVLFNSPGLLDFPVGIMDYVHYLPNGQVIEVSLENFGGYSMYRSTVGDELLRATEYEFWASMSVP